MVKNLDIRSWNFSTFPKAALLSLPLVLVFTFGLMLFARANFFSFGTLLSGQKQEENRILSEVTKSKSGNVLAAQTKNIASIFGVNIKSIFRDDAAFLKDLTVGGNATISGTLTAPNIIYTVNAGSGIAVTPGQNPIISSAETLQTVTTRGATTTVPLTLNGGVTFGSVLNLGKLATEPTTAVNGAMYYNTTTNVFRCYQNGSWKDCDTNAVASGTITSVGTGDGLSGGGSSGGR